MPTVAVSLTPVDRARRRIELPVISADDSPSRNPCKVRDPSRSCFRNEPYGFRAVSHLPGGHAVQPVPGLSRRVVPTMQSLVPPSSEQEEAAEDTESYPAAVRMPRMMGALEAPMHSAPHAPMPPREEDEEPRAEKDPLSATDHSSERLPLSVAPRPPAALGATPPRGMAAPPVAAVGETTGAAEEDWQESPVYSGPRVASQFAPDAKKAATPPPPPPLERPTRRPPAVVVKFKHQDGVFLLPDPLQYPEPFVEGDFVIVEGDRGEHIGRIDQMTLHHHHVTSTVGNIIRKAYPPEIEAVRSIRQQEPQITKQVQQLAQEMDVAMKVIDTEVQSDRNKITIYYVSKVGSPVDFRQLQRRLFREFRCRIWFVDWDTM